MVASCAFFTKTCDSFLDSRGKLGSAGFLVNCGPVSSYSPERPIVSRAGPACDDRKVARHLLRYGHQCPPCVQFIFWLVQKIDESLLARREIQSNECSDMPIGIAR